MRSTAALTTTTTAAGSGSSSSRPGWCAAVPSAWLGSSRIRRGVRSRLLRTGVLLGAAIAGSVLLALALHSMQLKPYTTIAIVEYVTLVSVVQIYWQIPNSIDARKDRDVSRGFPNFAVRRIDFRYAAHVLRLLIAIGYLAVGIFGILAPTIPVPPNFPFLDSAEDWSLGITVIAGETGFAVLSAWDYYRRRADNDGAMLPPVTDSSSEPPAPDPDDDSDALAGVTE